MTAPVLAVSGLTTVIRRGATALPAVSDVSFDVGAGEVVGLVGESGSGKSLTALSVVRMLPAAASVTAGTVALSGRDLLGRGEEEMRAVRGNEIGMVFQDPLAYLNPRMTVGRQLAECGIVHGQRPAAAKARALELLDLVGIEDAARRLDDYPHQFSGGMRQRVLIAMAIANDPALLIADEPTTALDVTVQAEILRLIVELRDKLGIAVLIITHDMSIVEQICDTAMVMYGGRIVEHGPVRRGDTGVLGRPRHPYTQALLRSVPRLDAPPQGRLPTIGGTPPDLHDMPAGCAFAPRCARAEADCRTRVPVLAALDGTEPTPRHQATAPQPTLVACWHPVPTTPVAVAEPPPAVAATVRPQAKEPVLVVDDITVRYGSASVVSVRRRGTTRAAVDGVSLAASRGHILGIIGESGSGKSTVARAMLGLLTPQRGEVRVDGRSWAKASRHDQRRMRRAVQLVFQDPYLSLNPRLRVADILAEPLQVHGIGDRSDRAARLTRLMELVGLRPAFGHRYPHELSGGQRQRVGIARALAVEPEVIVADEPVSALDVSVQAQIVNLLSDLRTELDVGIVLIAHDLGLVRHCCDDTLVMHRGKVVERGPSQSLFADPQHPYTRQLIAAGHHTSR